MLGMLGLLGVRGGTMKINSDIQKIVDSKVDECADDAEIAALEAGDALNAWDARHALIAWSHYENQF